MAAGARSRYVIQRRVLRLPWNPRSYDEPERQRIRIRIAARQIDGAPLILRNDGGNQKHWITLEVIGNKSNRLGIGAKVTAVAGPLVQVDEVGSGGSYLSQNDLRIHFGLGEAEKVDRVSIRWPSGRDETLQGLAADRFYVVKEGQGIVPREHTLPPRQEQQRLRQ
jgi:hypothetical protein